ncbi:MAG TPA: hypothetical protein VE553_07590 [Candidatus Binatia bacterium]|jgi:uncharacterized Zn finger protein (UPF0148 family)|nr:hypothetical protein [Candidatus Binatia bacterium]
MSDPRVWRCDRCGFQMIERHCKIICPNCGARWDCSDVTIWVADGEVEEPVTQAESEPSRPGAHPSTRCADRR